MDLARLLTETIILLACVLVSQGCDSNSRNTPGGTRSRSEPSNPNTPTERFSETVVTPYMDREIKGGTNLIWCATFQMTWDGLRSLCGGPVETSPGSVSVLKLNRESVSPDALPQTGILSAAGLVRDGIIEDIQRQVRQLPGTTGPSLVPTQGSLPDNAVVLYAYLIRSLRYSTPFAPLPAMSFGHSGEIAAFGIEDYSESSEKKRLQGKKVRILWHSFEADPSADGEQEFIVELLTSESGDHLILARISPSPTLGKTVARVMELVKQPNKKRAKDGVAPEVAQMTKLLAEEAEQNAIQKVLASISGYSNLLQDEDLTIPKVRVDVVRSFTDLVGQRVVSTPEKVRNKPIIDARQGIRFDLNERGADLESEAVTVLFGDMAVRDFTFSEPFLVLLMRKGADRPYFAMWVANTELLVTSEMKKRP